MNPEPESEARAAPKPDAQRRLPYGSVTGVLEASPDSGGVARFVIKEAPNREAQNRRVKIGRVFRCVLEDADLARRAEQAAGQRVSVSGKIAAPENGGRGVIFGTWLRVVTPQDELPSLDEMRGIAPNMTGGLPSEVYVKNLWRRPKYD